MPLSGTATLGAGFDAAALPDFAGAFAMVVFLHKTSAFSVTRIAKNGGARAIGKSPKGLIGR
jgi:hypothetical protein